MPRLKKVELIGKKEKSCHFHSLENKITFKINFVCTNNMFQYFFFSIYEERNSVSSFKTPWSVNFIMPGLLCPFSCSILICLIQKMGKKSTFLQFCKFQFYSTQYLKLMKDIKNVDHYFKISTFRLFYYTYWNDNLHKSKFVKPKLTLYIFFNRKLFISSFCMYAQNHLFKDGVAFWNAISLCFCK